MGRCRFIKQSAIHLPQLKSPIAVNETLKPLPWPPTFKPLQLHDQASFSHTYLHESLSTHHKEDIDTNFEKFGEGLASYN